MEKQNWVSLWIGTAKSTRALEKYVEGEYSDDGDYSRSQFERDFRIDFFDEDFIETKHCRKPTRSLRRLLRDCSSHEAIIDQFVAIVGEELTNEAMSVVLLYNFLFRGRTVNSVSEAVSLRFVGTARYR